MENERLIVETQTLSTGTSNINYAIMDSGWRPADESPKAMFSLSRDSHIRRSKPIWLLQGSYTYRHNDRDPLNDDAGEERTDPAKIVLGYCVWPLVRFIGKRRGKEGTDFAPDREYEQWIPTKEHYFVSLEHDTDHIFPAQFWREIDLPPMPINVPRDDHFRWGIRHVGWNGKSEIELGSSKWLKGLRRASTDEPYCGEDGDQ